MEVLPSPFPGQGSRDSSSCATHAWAGSRFAELLRFSVLTRNAGRRDRLRLCNTPPPPGPARYLVARDHGLPSFCDVHLLVNVLHRDVLASPGSLGRAKPVARVCRGRRWLGRAAGTLKSAPRCVGGERVIRIAGTHKIGTRGAQQSFDLLDCFPNHAARLAALNLAF